MSRQTDIVSGEVAEIKRALFARRNGVVADALRSAGNSHSFIMGCSVAELAAFASSIEVSQALAEALWTCRQHRECRLIATMLYPADTLSAADALAWADDVRDVEEADVLCHKLLRHCGSAEEIVLTLITRQEPLAQYTALRLATNLLLLNRLKDKEKLLGIINGITPANRSISRLIVGIKEEL